MSNWNTAQQQEKDWWTTCTNTLGEELKQLVYAEKMGLNFIERDGRPFILDLEGKRVMDIGGGPCSLLLKAINSPLKVVIDPCPYPNWVYDRYSAAGIFWGKDKGEEIPYTFTGKFDEIWIYNVLQHTEDPAKVIENAKRVSKLIRIFEWIDAETNEMHPHTLTEEKLNEWLGGKGTIETLNNIKGCTGKCYYATIPISHS